MITLENNPIDDELIEQAYKNALAAPSLLVSKEELANIKLHVKRLSVGAASGGCGCKNPGFDWVIDKYYESEICWMLGAIIFFVMCVLFLEIFP